jgi:long-chain fatty acid transport protein
VAHTSRLVVAVTLLLSSTALAGNMFLPVRGARAIGRGGAFTAGVDDASAIYYNPAGMVDIDELSVLGDFGLVFQRPSYTRVDSGGNPQPRVDGQMNLLPIPTLAVTGKPPVRGRWLTLGGGIWVPYLGINSWPENGPQRYGSITLNGSLIAVMEFAAAFRIHENFWLGVGLQNMVLHFHSRVMLSACSQLNCAPEDPHFDSLTQVDSDSWFTPSGVIGAIFALPKFRAGLNVQLPFFVRSSGKVHSILPSDPFFANSELHYRKVNGQETDEDSVGLDFDLPLQLRLGAEYRPTKRLRLELDVDYEAWSMQQNFAVKPKGVYISGVPGIGNYYLGTMYVVRGLRDTFAVHLGLEAEVVRRLFWVRTGWALETDATPNEAANVLTPDALRNLITVGFAVKVWKARADIGYAHVFFQDRDVNNSRSLQLNPIQPALAVPVGNGHYSIAADVLSLGLDGRF